MPSYGALADAVALIHALFVGFVVVGLPLIIVGLLLRWRWVRNFWFRIAHLAAILLVVVQSYAAVACPLTDLESDLRVRAGQAAYGEQGFIAHWVHRLIFFDAPSWVFTLAYSFFALAVLATFLLGPPRWPQARRRSHLATDEHR